MEKIILGLSFGLVGIFWLKMDYDCGNSDKSWKGFVKYFLENC